MHGAESICHWVLVGSGPDVPELAPVAFYVPVRGGKKHVMADIEFPPVVQEGFLDVLLDYVGSVGAVVEFYAVS